MITEIKYFVNINVSKTNIKIRYGNYINIVFTSFEMTNIFYYRIQLELPAIGAVIFLLFINLFYHEFYNKTLISFMQSYVPN